MTPCAENEAHLRACVNRTIDEYVGWTRNYFPRDAKAIPSNLVRELVRHLDALARDARREHHLVVASQGAVPRSVLTGPSLASGG